MSSCQTIVAKFNSHSSCCYWKHKELFIADNSKPQNSSSHCMIVYTTTLLSTAYYSQQHLRTFWSQLSQLQTCTQSMHTSMHGKCSYLNQTAQPQTHCHDGSATCMHQHVSYSFTFDFHACTYE